MTWLSSHLTRGGHPIMHFSKHVKITLKHHLNYELQQKRVFVH